MSDSPKHTPGPWEEHGKGGCECGLIFGPDGNSNICLVYGPSHLASDDGPDCVPNRDAQQANARLISAAPDLLAALQAVVAVADRKTVEFDMARAAIAKALGDADAPL